MTDSTSATTQALPRRPGSGYAPPTALADLHILDFLELAGTQARAGAALAIHQTTVGRSLQLMQHQFRLVPRQGPAVCRNGHNACLLHLRLASREHRLMAGLLRIGTDVLHQRLLRSMETVQRVPPGFRTAEHWAELVRHGLLDGALLSSFGLEHQPQTGPAPAWEGLVARPVGQAGLQLVASGPDPRRVLLPPKATAPRLHQAMVQRGYGVEPLPAACEGWNAWIQRARERRLALPICPDLLRSGWLERHGLQPLVDQPVLIEQLWLLLPEGAANGSAAHDAIRALRRQLSRGDTRPDANG